MRPLSSGESPFIVGSGNKPKPARIPSLPKPDKLPVGKDVDGKVSVEKLKPNGCGE